MKHFGEGCGPVDLGIGSDMHFKKWHTIGILILQEMTSKSSKKSPQEPTPRKVPSAGKNKYRLFRQPRSPYLQVRVMVDGKRSLFSTGETAEKAAKSRARTILADIKSRGFEEAIQLHARKKEEAIGSNPTLEELGKSYESNLRFFDKAPSPETARYYTAK